MLKSLWNGLAAIGFVFLGMTALAVGASHAHSGSPTPTTWSSGNTLTAANLNDTISHLHNTFNAGIVDAHLSSSAAIAHSKLATPALVAKAVLSTTTVCDGTGADGTDCTAGVEHSKFLSTSGGAGVGNSALEARGGLAGQYYLTLSYSPTNTNYVVVVTSMTTQVFCTVVARRAGAPAGVAHFDIDCENDASADTNANISIVVFDTD